MTTPTPIITNEQINDLPLLMGILDDIGIEKTIDSVVKPHGHWKGVSVGTLISLWLCHMLQEQDHRMVTVREWAQRCSQTINDLLGTPLRDTDCTDDRLANILSMLGNIETQQKLDFELVNGWIQAYELPVERVRLDSTSVSVYHKPDDPKSLLQLGHSKDHRPDLRQYKIMMASLDTLGMPICAQIVPGNRADDGLYVPAYEAATKVLGKRNLLYVGDGKMGALGTRGHLASHGSSYLCAFRAPCLQERDLSQWLDEALAHQKEWQPYETLDVSTGELVHEADIYSFQRNQIWVGSASLQGHAWTERVMLMRTFSAQRGAFHRLQTRMERLCKTLEAFREPPKRGRKRYSSESELAAVISEMVAKSDLTGIIEVSLHEETLPDGTARWTVGSVSSNYLKWEALIARSGWLVYLSNTTLEQYSVQQLVGHYRNQIIQERGFSRLKTRNLQIRPVYVRDEERIAGLVWLLSLALRVLTLIEYRTREELAKRKEALTGLNPGSRSQGTTSPTAERILSAFKNITQTTIQAGETQIRNVTSLTKLQQQILPLLRLPDDLYSRLVKETTNWQLNLRE